MIFLKRERAVRKLRLALFVAVALIAKAAHAAAIACQQATSIGNRFICAHPHQ